MPLGISNLGSIHGLIHPIVKQPHSTSTTSQNNNNYENKTSSNLYTINNMFTEEKVKSVLVRSVAAQLIDDFQGSKKWDMRRFTETLGAVAVSEYFLSDWIAGVLPAINDPDLKQVVLSTLSGVTSEAVLNMLMSRPQGALLPAVVKYAGACAVDKAIKRAM